jgi:uncharacterized SAM-binding protein YcdF (DUF218 family)
MSKFERFGETIKSLYIEKSSDKKIEELCKSIEMLNGKYDKAIVVLTGGLSKAELPSGDEHIKTEFVAHIREAAAAMKYKELLSVGHRPVIVVSGGKVYGKGDNMPILSEVMKAELIRKYGVNEEDILTEPCSVDTSQNARFSSKLLDALGFSETDDKSVFLITNQFHLSRATTLFSRHFNGNLEPTSAERILIDSIQQLPNNKTKTPYKRIIEDYLNSRSNMESTQKDGKLHKITELPLGEKVIEALAYYLRSSEKEKKIPIINPKEKIVANN